MCNKLYRLPTWLRHSVPTLALGLTSVTTTVLTPAIVGLYVDSFGLSVGLAGYTAAIYLLGAGAGGVLIGMVALRVRTRTLLVLGLLLLSLGNFLSITSASVFSIFVVRLIAGIGEGICFGLMGAFIARLEHPGRVFGTFTILAQVCGALVLWSLPWVREEFGPRMILIPIASAPLCILGLLRTYPELTMPSERRPTKDRSVGSETSVESRYWLMLSATFVLYVAYGGVFAYIERLGVLAGISPDDAARLLASGSLLALAGAAFATLLAGPHAIAWKIVSALAGVVCSVWAVVSGISTVYIVGVLSSFVLWSFFVPNLMTLSFLADREGRLGAATLGAMQWGMAAGPAITASYVSVGNLAGVGPIATVGFAGGLALLVPALRELRRSRASD